MNDAATNKIAINAENIVCLNISTFMFSFLLSFMIDLYNFIPLTPSANTHGMYIIFCNNNDAMQNQIPLNIGNVIIIEDIV